MLSTTFFLFVLLFCHGAYSHPANTLLGNPMKFKELKSVKLQGKEYEVKLLSSSDQGSFSDTYEIVGQFNGMGAILKVVPNGTRENQVDNALEVKYLKKRGLLLHSERHSEAIPEADYIVVRDMEKNIPPYRPFYEWYEMDKDMDLAKALRDVRRAVGNQLREIAHRDGLLYYDYHMNNVFVDKELKLAVPIDWGPQTDNFDGVVENLLSKSTGEYDAKTTEFNEELKRRIRTRYNATKLKMELNKHRLELREQDEALVLAEEAEAAAEGA